MSKNPPTLADAIIREWQRPPYRKLDPNNWLATHVAQARKFVLDESMSAFMADLSYASFTKCRTAQARHHLIEGMRKLSRLPHAATWIEYDKQAQRKRVKEAYHPDISVGGNEVPDRSGWLLAQHPTIETAFYALHCTSHAWDNDNIRMDSPNTSHFAFAWTVDDTPPPWPKSTFIQHGDQLAEDEYTGASMKTTAAGVLVGVLEYVTDTVSVIQAPHIPRDITAAWLKVSERHFNTLGELAHDARYLWSLLATINDLPVVMTKAKPTRGYVSRGSYKKFCEHTIITLNIPEKRYRTVANRAIAIARRRGHQVRGHFRKNRFHPNERIWIREHVRGDTSLGFVTHDYNVNHPTE